ncbi:hypothetical protein [Actinoplanes sp. NPDC049681]|uniref:hypothetical protein n=1 Tax=Actinoplanes sp. NPDC049681 TaxID=3363905 RepID=UPI0037B169AC
MADLRPDPDRATALQKAVNDLARTLASWTISPCFAWVAQRSRAGPRAGTSSRPAAN